MVKIVSFEPKYAADFLNINEEWISHYFRMEAEDYKYLENPQTNIIDKGGAILVALLNEKAVGVCALVKINDHKFELAKMGVRPAAQGKKVGWLLGLAAIEKAKNMGATTLFLESNRILVPAINLYKKLGFVVIQGGCSLYERCDIQMELEFNG